MKMYNGQELWHFVYFNASSQSSKKKQTFFLQEKALKHVAKTGQLTIHAHAAILCLVLSRSRGEKSGEGLVPIYVTDRKWWTRFLHVWTRFHNDGNMPTQYAASTASHRTVKFV